MTRETIANKVNAALAKLHIKDVHLLKENLNERCITHKLAEYLRMEFRGYDVDCEYNGNVKLITGEKAFQLLYVIVYRTARIINPT